MNRKKIHTGKLIKEKLKEKGMTQQEFADRLFVSRSHVCNILASDDILLKRLIKIEEILDCNLLQYFEKEPSKDNIRKFVIEITDDNSTITRLE
ncbi:MAG: helix-turn-helix transcriptional regulator [Bacteroidales bacterium]|jgi:transcriptional regulator with XRE-family HTH domain|nr:helix-turn-helix transcriptional regulator [Bacteroidales bacterium]